MIPEDYATRYASIWDHYLQMVDYLDAGRRQTSFFAAARAVDISAMDAAEFRKRAAELQELITALEAKRPVGRP